MSASPPAMRLTGAAILRDGEFHAAPVAVEGGLISDARLPEVDLSGFLVLPGIVDLHGDAFERHLRPRPSAPFPAEQALVSTDRDAAANGLTTAWMAQSWSWEGGHRGPGFAETFLQALDTYRPRMQTDLRVQIRCETHTTDTLERLLEAVEAHAVGYVIFNNHLDETLALAETDSTRLEMMARAIGQSPEAYTDALHHAKRQAQAVPRYLCTLAAAFDRLGIRYGSHDDRHPETRETYSMIGAKICEFPLTRAVAKLARAVGDPVLMGAPNVVRGGSQKGHVSALELVALGKCDALVSDYHYPSMAAAAFRLADEGVLSFARAWKLISENPARIMRLNDRGTIAEGKRADLAIVNTETRQVEATLVAGRVTHLTGEAALRFLASPGRLAMAAE
ncbi:alpha-D-ribose 1-methylphosphonate 5-triphosphate diphosphatase [Roseovarius sp.]|uniref:alpha-D-ribose 1-methylphosphonate 5-triphosphate diphosphatase n=1 Tax=Roseovarius sp. TaxID=1486281 RepID=UPI00260A9A9D|nr:alpha-D-ribose 1-methylphosphonate 5-triphosphate diphosphatase [Roseovarius sp.]MDM8168494.1 alpha-D-ribose 1-methylphosphonate 5-triphosphate diphosphatase [Roseovarius sp.]